MLDRRIVLERLEHRALFAAAPTTGSIFGTAFVDSNNNGVRDTGEIRPLVMRPFLDDNRNGRHDLGERTARVSIRGHYRFDDLPPGTYRVAYEPFLGFASPQPGAGYNVTIHAGESRRRTFPVQPPAMISGTIFIDSNSDGVRQPAEPFSDRQVKVYLDLNNNLQYDHGEPFNDSNTGTGRYSLLYVLPGSYVIRVHGHGQTFTTRRTFSTTLLPGGSVTKHFGLAP